MVTRDPSAPSEPSGGRFMRRAKEFLLGTPIELVDPAKIHISQVTDEVYNAGTTNSSANCGPTSVIMAIRMVGRQVPGEDRLRGEDLVLHVRQLATGGTDRWTGTHNFHLQRVLELAECSWSIHRDVRDMLAQVREGEPVIMAGNPTNPGCYTHRFPYYDIRRWDGGHWIVVSRYNREAGTYTVNDHSRRSGRSTSARPSSSHSTAATAASASPSARRSPAPPRPAPLCPLAPRARVELCWRGRFHVVVASLPTSL